MCQLNINIGACFGFCVFTLIMFQPFTGEGQQSRKSEIVLQLLEEIQIARSNGDFNQEVDALTDLAIAYHTARLYKKAAEVVTQAKMIINSKEVKPTAIAGYYLAKAILINGRPIKKGHKEYDRMLYNRRIEALHWVSKVEQLQLQSDSAQLTLAWSYCLKSQYFWQNLKDLPHLEPADSVIHYVRKALNIPATQMDPDLVQTLYGRLSNYYLHFDQLDSANFYLSMQNRYVHSGSNMVKTHYYHNLHEYYVRLHGLDTLLVIHDSLFHNYTEIVLGHNSLALFDKDQKYEATKAKNDLSDTREKLDNSEKALVVAGASGTLILFIAGFIFKLYRKNLSLSKRNEELVREQNHRVKNNLQMLASMFSLQAENIQDASLKSSLVENEQRVQSLALLHRRLYDQELVNVNAREYIEEMVLEILFSMSAGHIRTHFNIESIDLPVNKMVHLGLVINELVTNSIKHAFQKQTEPSIRITLYKKNSTVSIEYADNGKGCDEKAFMEGNGFGTQLIQSQVKQLKGSYSHSSRNGFLCTISFSCS